MRPRVFPAEDSGIHVVGQRIRRASMRPRVFPAEDGVLCSRHHTTGYASMRPRVFPAEDAIKVYGALDLAAALQ